jgi:hypothetical protein
VFFLAHVDLKIFSLSFVHTHASCSSVSAVSRVSFYVRMSLSSPAASKQGKLAAMLRAQVEAALVQRVDNTDGDDATAQQEY